MGKSRYIFFQFSLASIRRTKVAKDALGQQLHTMNATVFFVRKTQRHIFLLFILLYFFTFTFAPSVHHQYLLN